MAGATFWGSPMLRAKFRFPRSSAENRIQNLSARAKPEGNLSLSIGCCCRGVPGKGWGQPLLHNLRCYS